MLTIVRRGPMQIPVKLIFFPTRPHEIERVGDSDLLLCHQAAAALCAGVHPVPCLRVPTTTLINELPGRDLWGALAPSRRAQIRQAERLGVEVVVDGPARAAWGAITADFFRAKGLPAPSTRYVGDLLGACRVIGVRQGATFAILHTLLEDLPQRGRAFC
jgi:hypothetical protein